MTQHEGTKMVRRAALGFLCLGPVGAALGLLLPSGGAEDRPAPRPRQASTWGTSSASGWIGLAVLAAVGLLAACWWAGMLD